MTTPYVPDEDDLAALAQGVWGQRDQGILVDPATRAITAADVEYIRSRCPYIQILNMDATFENFVKVNFITAKSGWIIQDLDDGLCSSIGSYLFGGAASPKIEDIENKDAALLKKFVNAGKGTVVKQTFDTAQEMVEMIKSRWPGGIEIISGSDLMKWSLWVGCQQHNINVVGYVPTEEDKRKRLRLVQLEKQKPATPKPNSRNR